MLLLFIRAEYYKESVHDGSYETEWTKLGQVHEESRIVKMDLE
jgi:hypothetical protein